MMDELDIVEKLSIAKKKIKLLSDLLVTNGIEIPDLNEFARTIQLQRVSAQLLQLTDDLQELAEEKETVVTAVEAGSVEAFDKLYKIYNRETELIDKINSCKEKMQMLHLKD